MNQKADTHSKEYYDESSKLPQAFWSLAAEDLLKVLQTAPEGLSSTEAENRTIRYGFNRIAANTQRSTWLLFLHQFSSPIILILIGAAVLSFFLHDATDAIIILSIVLASSLLGFWQEQGASNIVARLLARVQIKITVLRDGQSQEIATDDIVPGDMIVLSAGSLIPADAIMWESRNLFVDEAALTGETFPVDKQPGVLPAQTPFSRRTNVLFMGTHVVSGTGKALVVQTGLRTEYGKIAARLKLRPPLTEFQRGVRHFGYLLAEVTFVMLIAVFAVNVLLHRPVFDSLLFALALSVGVTPQLLPAIISVNLSRGARRMADCKVIVKRLESIENFGSMDILCSDKTGTLTEGTVHVEQALDPQGTPSEKVSLYAYLNAIYETGFVNPIDQAIRENLNFDITGWTKQYEIPYDFIRKRLSILFRKDDRNILITKGAVNQVLEICSQAETADGRQTEIGPLRESIQQQQIRISDQGRRMLAVAYKDIATDTDLTHDQEGGMIFLGFLVLSDPLKPQVRETVRQLRELGVNLTIITGDHVLVARHVAQSLDIAQEHILTGSQIKQMSDEALIRRASQMTFFAEIEPNQKERIILALKKAGHVVGYMGDGINDMSALHAADVGISVEDAADAAKDAADLVLLEKDLNVLIEGVREGRRTFANTLKYVFAATSANFGNMFSMAGASLFLPFLPLLPKQILLTNVITDLPEMTIAGDNVDPELVKQPRRWDVKFIRRFMVTFGLISSLFDFLTFGVLLLVLDADTEQFRTGWFVESIISAAFIVLVIRSRRPFYRSKPAFALWVTTAAVIIGTAVLPYLPVAGLLGFTPLPFCFYLIIGVIIMAYIITVELAKRVFYTKIK